MPKFSLRKKLPVYTRKINIQQVIIKCIDEQTIKLLITICI